jgi:hypothetical protein
MRRYILQGVRPGSRQISSVKRLAAVTTFPVTVYSTRFSQPTPYPLSLSLSLFLSLSLCSARSNFTKTAHLAICYLLWENIDITAVLLLAFVGTRDAGNLRESLLQESLESVSSRTERIFPL